MIVGKGEGGLEEGWGGGAGGGGGTAGLGPANCVQDVTDNRG